MAWPGPGCSACETKLGCMALRGGFTVAGVNGAAMIGAGGGTKAGGGAGEPNDIIYLNSDRHSYCKSGVRQASVP